MARRVTLAALLSLATLLALASSLDAQTDANQSAVPEAGFGPTQTAPPVAAPASPASSTPEGIALPPNTSAPTIHVYSRETILDVLVTDDQGRPVPGLSRADFTILEDGDPQPIRGFSESSTTAPPPPPPCRPTHTPTPIPCPPTDRYRSS